MSTAKAATHLATSDAVAIPGLDFLGWPGLGRRLDEDGFAMIPQLLSRAQCAEVSAMFDDDERFRSTVVMARHAFGEGTYRYFAEPLPPIVQTLRTELYPPLATIANDWAGRLGERAFPGTLDGLRLSPGTAAPRRERSAQRRAHRARHHLPQCSLSEM